jgi:anti-sigma factor RsiW
MAPLLHRYLDGELAPAETMDVEAHLLDCRACREQYEALTHVVGSIRVAHPLYTPPPGSYRRAERQVRAHRRRQWALQGGAAAAVLGILLAAWFMAGGHARSHDRFADFAANAHVRQALGWLPLDLRSSDHREVENWLGERLPFRVSLSDSAEPTLRHTQLLRGARLMQYGNKDAAYLSYQVEGHEVSLVVMSSLHDAPQGGVEQTIGRLTFHTIAHNGLKTVLWADKGLAYALVSNLSGTGAQACVICHQDSGGRNKFAGLR